MDEKRIKALEEEVEEMRQKLKEIRENLEGCKEENVILLGKFARKKRELTDLHTV